MLNFRLEMVQEINLEEVIASKNPRLLRMIPSFVLKYLKRILHINDLNEALRRFGHLEGYEFLDKTIEYLDVKCEVVGLEKLSPSERYLFVSNHPMGGLDGILLLHSIYGKFGEVKSLSNDFLMVLSPLRSFFVPVNKHGSQGTGRFLAIRSAFESQAQMMTFPAGLCSRMIKGQITDLEWKSSFVKSARQSGRTIVPIFFDGKNSAFFYRLSYWRKKLGIKLNIEMLYLVDEMFSKKGAKFRAYVGDPITYDELNSSPKSVAEWTRIIRKKTYELNPSK